MTAHIRLLLLLSLAGLLTPLSAQGQWIPITRSLFGRVYASDGAMCYCHGRIWAGSNDLYMSPDSGATWIKLTRPSMLGDQLVSIHFFDTSYGVATVAYYGTYVSTDGGLSWSYALQGDFPTCEFGPTPRDILVVDHNPGRILISNDMGSSWRTYQFPDQGVIDLHVGPDSLVVVSAGSQNSQGHLYISTDLGTSFTQIQGSFDHADSYSFAFDSCSRSNIYVANENYHDLGNSEIFISKDGGVTWTTGPQGPVDFLSGSVEVGPHSVYLQTVHEGILRSTDFGKSWSSIGGPVAFYDTRTVCVVNDNLLYSLDTGGRIWKTTNSGGDSVIVPIRLISFESADQTQDTIGGEVFIPFQAYGGYSAVALPLSVQYDPVQLEWVGAYDLTGKMLSDSLLDDSTREFRILPAMNSNDTVAGTIRFQYFPTTDCTRVLLSHEVPDATTCSLSIEQVNANICSPNKCGTILLSQFLRTGTIDLSEVKAMYSDGVLILSSNRILKDCRVEGFDEIGRSMFTTECSLTSNPLRLMLNKAGTSFIFLSIEYEGASRIIPCITR